MLCIASGLGEAAARPTAFLCSCATRLSGPADDSQNVSIGLSVRAMFHATRRFSHTGITHLRPGIESKSRSRESTPSRIPSRVRDAFGRPLALGTYRRRHPEKEHWA